MGGALRGSDLLRCLFEKPVKGDVLSYGVQLSLAVFKESF